MTERVVVLVDMDCFYVQVEERDHPHIKGVPAAVVQYNTWRGGGIIAVNYEARAEGVKRSMRGDEARGKCPDIHLVQVPVNRGKADLTKYREAGKEVLQVLSDFTDRIERASIDEAYLDLTDVVGERLGRGEGLRVSAESLPSTWVVGGESEDKDGDRGAMREKLLREWLAIVYSSDDDDDTTSPLTLDHPHWDARRLICAAEICEEMRRAVLERTGFKCSAGIAHNKMLAKLTCGLHKPNQQTVLPQGGVAGLWAGMDVGRVRNLGGKLGDTLTKDLGCTTMAHLAAISLAQLRGRFDDKTALWLHNLGRGIDHELVISRQLPKSIGCGKNFMGREALNTRDKVEKWTRSLVEELCERLQDDQKANKRKARTITVVARLDGEERWTSLTRSCPLPSYIPDRITRLALSLIQHTNQAAPKDPTWTPSIKHIGLSASRFEDWEGSTSGNIQAMFKKAAMNNSKLATEKAQTSFTEDEAGSSPQPARVSHTHTVSDTTDNLMDDSCKQQDSNKADENSLEILRKDIQKTASSSLTVNGIDGQTKSPGNSFFKKFLLKRKQETEQKLNVGAGGIVGKDSSDSAVETCSDDDTSNLDLLVSCLESDNSESSDCEEDEDLDKTFCEIETDSLSNDVNVVEEKNSDNTKNLSSISLSPDLFSSEGSSESSNIAKVKQNTDHSSKNSLLKLSSESHTKTSNNPTPGAKSNGGDSSSNLISKFGKSTKPSDTSGNPSVTPENTDPPLCQVSVKELFPNLDDFDSSLLPLLPDGLREKVEVELARHKAESQKLSNEKAGISKFVQKSPNKGDLSNFSKSNTGTPVKVAIPGSSNSEVYEEYKSIQRYEASRCKTNLDIYINKTSCLSENSEKYQEIEECPRNEYKCGGLHDNQESNCKGTRRNTNEPQGVTSQDETDCGRGVHTGGSQGSESDLVECQECGKRISAFDLPEHLDFHVALRLQSELRSEEFQSAGPSAPRVGRVDGKRGKGRKRGKASKVDMESRKMQKIDAFFTR